MKSQSELLLLEKITHYIHLIRDQKVMMDSDLSILYGVSTRVLNQAVKRNLDRFPIDFMFQLTMEEWNNLKSQSVIPSDRDTNINQARSIWGGRRSLPFMFTEQGIAMLSSVLNSNRAIQINIEIMRVFVKLRQWATNFEELRQEMDRLNKNQAEQDEHIQRIYQIIEELVQPLSSERPPIGFIK
jgi:hypothetical protein